MYTVDTLALYDLTVEHLANPIGIDCLRPRFARKLASERPGTDQATYRLRIFSDGHLSASRRTLVADTGTVASSQSIEVEVPGFEAEPQTAYAFEITVTDAFGRIAQGGGRFETGLMGTGFAGGWVEPVQEPTPETMGTDAGAHAGAARD